MPLDLESDFVIAFPGLADFSTRLSLIRFIDPYLVSIIFLSFFT